jgi:hypothetical protein
MAMFSDMNGYKNVFGISGFVLINKADHHKKQSVKSISSKQPYTSQFTIGIALRLGYVRRGKYVPWNRSQLKQKAIIKHALFRCKKR